MYYTLTTGGPQSVGAGGGARPASAKRSAPSPVSQGGHTCSAFFGRDVLARVLYSTVSVTPRKRLGVERNRKCRKLSGLWILTVLVTFWYSHIRYSVEEVRKR